MPSMRKVISFLLQELKISTDEIIIHFVSDAKLCSLHKEFFNDPTSTDCITFPLDPPQDKKNSYHVIGEAFVCPRTALLYAKKHGIDPYEELCRYVAHCLLHMIGYDDIAPGERAKMKRKEKICLKKLAEEGLLKVKNPLRQRTPPLK
ncbi:MAG: rRNA maturation RNase YbeY [Verrucomicrobia bacterium]|nr:rRNA maturation RNase YbeY [Verrucomicrobiota bacterium]